MYWHVQSQHDDGVVLTAHVEFWLEAAQHDTGEPSLSSEEFIISRPLRTFKRIVTDASGRYLCTDGSYVIPWIEVNDAWQPLSEDPANPWVREMANLDMDQELTDVVQRYVERVF